MAQEEQRTDDLFGPRYHQAISLSGRERAYTIHNYEVNVHASPASSLGNVTSGSSKVQISTKANQNWELPPHPGSMVAANNHYLTYVLEGRSGYVLRLIHQDTNSRTLLKGFAGPVLDVAFAHATSNLLACVDQGGNLFVWDLDKSPELSDAQSKALRLHSERSSAPDHTHHRLSWCPYVPQEEGEEGEEDGWMLAVSHGCEVEVYSLGMLLSQQGQSNEAVVLQRGQEVAGRFTIAAPHYKPVLDLSLSPDGGVLATSSEDGHLKFWQVDWENENDASPNSLHDFSPHGGAPVTRLIFCDNHTTQDPQAQFWRFLITGANDNTEVKLWCTVSWKCLQTFRFLPPQDSSDPAHPNILLHLDNSASYLLATDTRRMTLYVFQLAMDGLMGQASLTSVTEYLLTQPILSFVVSGHTPFPTTNGDGESGESGEEGEGGRGEGRLSPKELDSRRTTMLIKLHCIHTRSMQELLVKFEPPDIMGIPPEPLPPPLFSGDMFSSEPMKTETVSDKPAPSTAEAQEEGEKKGEIEADTVQGEEEEEEEEEEKGEGEDGGEEEEERAPSPFDVFGQPASLPSSIHHALTTSANAVNSSYRDTFHSLPSLPGISPMLVTPSAFLSPTKIEIPTSTTSPPRFETSHTLPSPFNTSTISTSSANTLTTVTMSPSLEPSDATLDLTTTLEGQLEQTDGEPLQEHKREGELESEGEAEGAGGLGVFSEDSLLAEKRSSDLDEPRRKVSSAEESRGEEVGEGDGEREESLFSLVDQPSKSAAIRMTPEDFKEGFNDFNQQTPLNQPGPIRPQQMFTSTEKSEFVTLSSKALTPTREEGSEIVNTAGTPSAEYMEMFSQPRKGSKGATTPHGSETNEIVSSYDRLSSAWPSSSGERLNVSDDNAASAWPDVGGPEMPKLIPVRDHSDTEGGNTAYHTAVEGAGLGSEVSEVGQVGLMGEDPTSSREPSDEDNVRARPFAGVAFPLVLGIPKLEPTFPVARISETTEGETGQTLPAVLEQLSQTVGEEGRGGEEGEGEGEREMVEESAGAAAPQLVEIQPQPQLPLTTAAAHHDLMQGAAGLEVGVAVGGGAKGGRARRKKSKSKPSAAIERPAVSDSEPSGGGSVPLTEDQFHPIFTPPLTNEGMRQVGVVDHTHLAQLYQLVARQQEEIAALRAEQQQGFAGLQRQLEAVQRSTVEEQRGALSEHAREQQQKLDRVLKDKQVLDRQRQDRLISTVSQTLTSAVHAKLEKVVKSEMKNQVTPAVNRSLTSVQEQLSSTVQQQLSSSVQQKLTATNTALKEGITQILHSKGLPDAVGLAVAGSIRSTVQGTYEEAFRAVVLPAFERSSQEMFRQMDEAFRRGIVEYMTQLQQQFHQLSEPALQQLTSSYHALHSLLTSPQSPLLASLQHEIRSAMQSTIQGVSEGVSGVVREEVEAALQKHAHMVSPEAKAREERVHREDEIRRLLQSQEVNRAFELALSTADLLLVLYLCQQVTPEDVFDKSPCPLSQPVLLSLIQQLSVDVSEQMDLKLRYLEVSVLALDVDNDITRNHMTQVLRTLTKQLSAAEQSHRSNPNSAPLLRQIKRLRMITERLCHPHKP